MFRHGGQLPGGDSTADCRLRTVDGSEFRVQRGFLSATSPYFMALFSEELGSTRDFVIGGVKGSALDVMLTFLYTDQLFLSAANVLDVLDGSDRLLLYEVREKCLQLLLRFMAPQNCLSLAAITKRYSCAKFTDAVMAYTRAHFDEAWRCSEDFEETPAWLLYDLLASSELNIAHEEDALEAIARWYSAPGEKSSRLPELLRCVRIGVCDPEALAAFQERWPVLAGRAEYQEAVTQALTLGPCMGSRNLLLNQLLQLREPPKPAPVAPPLPPQLVENKAAGAEPTPNAAGKAFLALNSVAAAATAVASKATAIANRVAQEAAHPASSFMQLKQAYCNVCGLANPERWLPRMPTQLILVVGGWGNGHKLTNIESFDNRANHWFKFSCELHSRAYHGLVRWQRRLFLVGGICHQSLSLTRYSYLSSVCSFDLDTCQWAHHSDMRMTRAFVATAVLGGHIYAIGGHTGAERTSTVERCDPLSGVWTMVAAMNRRRSDASACVFNGRLFVSGGFSGSHILESVEVYTPSLDSWSIVQALPSPRCSHRMVVHHGRLLVIGGFDGQRPISSVISSEESRPLRWREMPSLIIPRSNFAVAQLGDELYVIGGYNGSSLVADVEVYRLGDDGWRQAKPLNTAARAFSACTVDGQAVCKKFSARGSTTPLDPIGNA